MLPSSPNNVRLDRVLAIGVVQSGLILTSSRGARQQAPWCGRTFLALLAALSAALRSVLAAVTVVLLAVLLTATVQGQGGGLFSAVEPAAARTRTRASVSTDALTMRRRLVTIDFKMLTRAQASAARPERRTTALRAGSPATLTLNLFDDAVFTGIVERTAPTFSGGYAVSGRLAGEPPGTMTLVVNGKVVAGTVRTSLATYRIRSAGGGLHAVSQVDPSKLPEGGEPLKPPPPEGELEKDTP